MSVSKKISFILCSFCFVMPSVCFADIASKAYVDVELEGKMDTTTVDASPTENSSNLVSSGGVKTYVDMGIAAKQSKPSSGVANGKVLTYTGTDANANVVAAYINVPIATAAPSTVSPTGFAELWVQP